MSEAESEAHEAAQRDEHEQQQAHEPEHDHQPERAPEPRAEPAPAPEPEPEMAAEAEEPAAPPPAPMIVGVEPDHGPLAGGTAVVVRGEGFVEGSKVLIGGLDAVTVWKDGRTLSATTPAGATKGMAELQVVNPDGQAALYEEDYRYDPPPRIIGTEPSCVSSEGGTVITILGADFVRGCAVRIDGELVPSSWAHGGRLEAVSKKHDPGEVVVAVENPDEQRAVRERAVRFAAPPRIDDVDPKHGPTSGGAAVTLRGSGFEAGCAVLVGGAPLEDVTVVSDAEVRFVTPPRPAPGAVDVAVVTRSGLRYGVPLAFTYVKPAPRVTSVSPEHGANAGGTELVVRGQDFDPGAAVFVCGIAVTATWKSPEEVVVVTPPVARDGLVDVRVVNADEQAGVAEKAFRYLAPLPPPELRQVGPSRGSQAGGLKVALYGESFAEGVTVRFGGVPAASVRFLTGKEIEAVTPAFTGHGEVAVEVVNPDGASSALAAAFTYEPKPAPQITGITPTAGPTTGGTRVLIEGTSFTRDAAVYVGREHPKDIVVKSATEIQIVTAARKTAGVVDVEVAVPGAAKAVMKNGFRYDAVPAPVITGVAPSAGAVGGGTELTVSGKNFTKESAVLVDGKAPKTVKLVDASTLECKTPPGEAGKMVDVVVRNPDGKEAVQKRAFLYDPRYRG
jgi:hypothetical protein